MAPPHNDLSTTAGRYVSTRGEVSALSFANVLTSGLALDGGLYVPEEFPVFSQQEIASWRKLSYLELVEKIIAPFIGDAIPRKDLQSLIKQAYSGFRHPDIAPLKKLDDAFYVLELFHGPTLAFKDFALQLLGRMLDYVLENRGQDVVVIGATSGDTGSAAIEGCKSCKHLTLFMLHPEGKVSDIQRRQMTTVDAPNIHNLAIDGTFDDCQDMVKAMFRNPGFLKGRKLVAVNSINWARIMAQVVYYFSSSLALGGLERPMAYAVPTGNFGDIYAGYVARRMGLPIEQLIIATNRNDILHRFLSANDYSKATVYQTFSPSMDIQVSSNLERLIFDLYDGDGKEVAALLENFSNTGRMEIGEKQLAKARKIFDSDRCDDQTTQRIIRETFEKYHYQVDPHTAAGIYAAITRRRDPSIPIIALATAHPAKFADVSIKALGKPAALPPHLADMMRRNERYDRLPHDLNSVMRYIAARA